MGLYLNGQLFAGRSSSAAEFGHMNHLPDGPLCRCGRRGCVEAYVADYSLLRWASGTAQTQAPSFNAIPEDDMLALEAAAATDARRAKGESLGLMGGVPIGMKDLFATKGVQTTAASHIPEGFTPEYESTVSQKLWEAGAG